MSGNRKKGKEEPQLEYRKKNTLGLKPRLNQTKLKDTFSRRVDSYTRRENYHCMLVVV